VNVPDGVLLFSPLRGPSFSLRPPRHPPPLLECLNFLRLPQWNNLPAWRQMGGREKVEYTIPLVPKPPKRLVCGWVWWVGGDQRYTSPPPPFFFFFFFSLGANRPPNPQARTDGKPTVWFSPVGAFERQPVYLLFLTADTAVFTLSC